MSQPATQDLHEDASLAPNLERKPASPPEGADAPGPLPPGQGPGTSSKPKGPPLFDRLIVQLFGPQAASTLIPALRTGGRWLLGTIITAHIVAIFAWSVPGDAPLVKRIRRFFEPYLLWSGLWQSWDMFSPNPMSINAYLEAELVMGDGSKKVWVFPRMDRMGLFDKFRYERYRKWAIDRVRLDAYSGIWPETTRYIARLYYDDPAGPPKEISLVRHWRTIKPPTQLWIPIGKEDEMLSEEKYTFFHYNVRKEDIQPPPPGAR